MDFQIGSVHISIRLLDLVNRKVDLRIDIPIDEYNVRLSIGLVPTADIPFQASLMVMVKEVDGA